MGLFDKKTKDKDESLLKLKVAYVGGHPEMPNPSFKQKFSHIEFKIFDKNIKFEPTNASKKWFDTTIINHEKIYSLSIAKNTFNKVRDLIIIDYHDDDHDDIQIRFQCMDFFSAKKCVELEDCIRNHNVSGFFRKKMKHSHEEKSGDTLTVKLEKLFELKNKGLISEDEFNEKKKSLLEEL